MTSETIAKNIRYYRQSRGFSIDKLAEISHISAQSIKNYESEITSPSSVTLYKISLHLGVPIQKFFEEDHD